MRCAGNNVRGSTLRIMDGFENVSSYQGLILRIVSTKMINLVSRLLCFPPTDESDIVKGSDEGMFKEFI